MARPRKEKPTLVGPIAELVIPVKKLEKDLITAATTLSQTEARFMVDTYYDAQKRRIARQGQIRSMNQAMEKEPHSVLDWLKAQDDVMEESMKNALGEFAMSRIVGRWSRSIVGIGPVISAGLIANIKMLVWTCYASPLVKKKRLRPKDQCTIHNPCSDLCKNERTNTVSRIWRYAGLDPTVIWGKGEKRPWNASLKVLAWKIGESFVKQSSNKNDFYGYFYRSRKELEIARNEQKIFMPQAEKILSTKNIGKDTIAYQWYSQGMLPPAHIQARSTRYAVKIFLSHWHEVAYFEAYGERPPKPYAIDVLGHKDQIQVPNWPF